MDRSLATGSSLACLQGKQVLERDFPGGPVGKILRSQGTYCNQVQAPQLLSMRAAAGDVSHCSEDPEEPKEEQCRRVHAPGSNFQVMTDGKSVNKYPDSPFPQLI